MSQRKTILHSFVYLVIGIVVGSCATGWYAWRQKSREIQESIIQTKYVQTITLIRLSETMENGEIESARYGLEESLNANISYMATNAYQNSKSGSMARETIKMAANHRTKYPFIANNPCINKMVAIAFQAVNWDGHSAPPHQVYWSE
jgi:hypothetical protein